VVRGCELLPCGRPAGHPRGGLAAAAHPVSGARKQSAAQPVEEPDPSAVRAQEDWFWATELVAETARDAAHRQSELEGHANRCAG